MDDYVRRVELRAYLIWEREGRPEGQHVDHWLKAQREVAEEDDAAGLQAGRSYDEGVKEFGKSGRVETAAKEARKALEGSEREDLERAQETGRRAGRGDDAAGKR